MKSYNKYSAHSTNNKLGLFPHELLNRMQHVFFIPNKSLHWYIHSGCTAVAKFGLNQTEEPIAGGRNFGVQCMDEEISNK
jgi:hypothetical protein